MTDRSIRSFALDYYRKSGADVQPHAGHDADAFTITPADGAKALNVTFAEDVAHGHNGPAALTQTSPQFRAILDDLTADIAVSYRYLVSKPIGNAPRVLEAALPEGWAVLSAKLLEAKNLPAVGFSHRVTFDSPALNARREVMHHHLWDVTTGLRLGTLEAALYDAPTLMIRPEHAPGEAVVKAFLDRSLALVDADTDARGGLIEMELHELLGEVETRANQYYEQQMGQVLAREAQLVEKLDHTIKRIAEAKTPEAVARLRQDGANLQNQIEHMRATREANLAAIEAACDRKLASERERHELTAMTDLVSICHASYDVVTYRANVVPPNGAPVELDVRYWPVSRELFLPDCPSCRGPMADPRQLEGGGIACGACVSACPSCGAVGDDDLAAQRACAACDTGLCRGCETTCGTCGGASCEAHAASCLMCEMALCARCDTRCTTCGEAVCRSHAHVDPLSGQLHCHAHRPVDLEQAPPAAILEAPIPVAEEPEDEEADAEAAAIPELPKLRWWSRLFAKPVAVEETLVAEAATEVAEEVACLAAPEVAEPVELEIADEDVYGEIVDVVEDAIYDEPVVELVAFIEEAPAPAPVEAEPAFAMAERAPYLDTVATEGPALDAETVAALPPEPALLAFTAHLAPVATLVAPAPAAAPARVRHGLTGETMAAAIAETCPACNDHFAVADMVDCATCGVPSCHRCATGELAPCPACESLQPTIPTDPRLDFVLTTFPKLARGRRRWEVAHVGSYIVTHWSRLGTWGMVVYHRGGEEREPAIVTEFAYGRLATLGQLLSFGRIR